jgi:hypothetical protein
MRRAQSAITRASIARSVRNERNACQPATKRETTSTQPRRVFTSAGSATPCRLGPGARNWRATGSAGRPLAGSGRGVWTRRWARTTPRGSSSRRRRSTAHRATRTPSRFTGAPDLVRSVHLAVHVTNAAKSRRLHTGPRLVGRRGQAHRGGCTAGESLRSLAGDYSGSDECIRHVLLRATTAESRDRMVHSVRGAPIPALDWRQSRW